MQKKRRKIKLNSFHIADVNGRPDADELIIGGSPARIEDFNWQILLIYDNVPFCGGSIITTKKIVTAAHCTYKIKNINRLRLRAGSAQPNAGGVLVSAVKMYENPNFNRPTLLNNDISVILLRETLTFGPTLGSISIGNGRPPTNAVAAVSGFGSTTIDGNRPSVLHSANVMVVDQTVCVQNYQNYPGKAKVTDNMLCAGLIGVGGKDACQGDSGG